MHKAQTDNTVNREILRDSRAMQLMVRRTHSQYEVVEKSMPFVRALLVVCMAGTLHWHDLAVRHVSQIADRL